MILDTSFLIHLFNGREDAFRKGIELAERRVVQRIPAPVLTEFTHGVRLTGTDEELRKLRNLTWMYPTVDLNPIIANRAGELHAEADRREHERTGAPNAGIDSIDSMVAATGDVLGEPVLTDNEMDFEKLGVEVETY